MVKNWVDWASGHRQLTKIGLSGTLRRQSIPTRFDLGTIAMNLKVIWEMSAELAT